MHGAYLGTAKRKTTATQLPFERFLKPPVLYARANFIRNTLTILVFFFGPLGLTLGLMNLQRSVTTSPSTAAFINIENFYIFLIPALPLVLTTYGVLYRIVLSRFPDHEFYQIYSANQGMSFKWSIEEVTPVLLKDRRAAQRWAWACLLTGPSFLLGFDSYTRVDESGVALNSFWSRGEQQWSWKQIASAELCGGVRSGHKGSRYFRPNFVLRTSGGQLINLSRNNFPTPSAPIAIALSTARVARRNNVPLSVYDLTPRQRQLFKRLSFGLQGDFNQLWQDVHHIAGTSVRPASAKSCECD
ncbi:MAG: hypothetical protein EOO38_15905 [Cytophagaceae bacterium]|nr:MAG: hypothetical protein EOO38_15905 [Cytophagaceae bacterium]